MVTWRITSGRRSRKMSASQRRRSWIGLYSFACRWSMSTAARFSTGIWNRRIYSWPSIILSNSGTLVYPRCWSARATTRSQCRARRTTCLRRYARTNRIPISRTYGPWAASCMSFALSSTPSTRRICWASFSRLCRTRRSLSMETTVMTWRS